MKYSNYTATVMQFRQSPVAKKGEIDREELFFMTAEMLYTLLEDWYGQNPAYPLWQNAQSLDCGDAIVIHSYDDAGLWLRLGINKDGFYPEIKTGTGRSGTKPFSKFWPYNLYSLREISQEGKIIFDRVFSQAGGMQCQKLVNWQPYLHR